MKLPKERRGYLEKYSPSLFAGWQRRYIILKDRKLKYYESDKPKDLEVPLGVVNFDHFKCYCLPVGDGKNNSRAF